VIVSGAQGPNFNGTGGGTIGYPYNGEGHVVGPCVGSTCTSQTLANPFIMTKGGTSGIIPTSTPSSSPLYPSRGDAAIKMIFSGTAANPIAVAGLSFSFEIFPDAGSSPPDFTFVMTSGVLGATVDANATVTGVTPGTASISYTEYAFPVYHPVVTQTNTFTHSPLSGPSSSELSKQYLGTMSFTFATPISGTAADPITLYFIDWPATVGVTSIDWELSVPEPTSLVLLASGLLGMELLRRRRRSQPQA
jgi:hypothetical protein